MAVLDRPAGADRPHVVASPPGTGGEASSTPDRVLMKGNEAIAEAAIAAGCDAYFGYPITPQAELLEWMARRMPEEGRVFVQAESELAAINMALGAAAAGARVLVSSSSPGISLMAEGMSYMAGSRLPCVLVNVMRGGPGLGQHRRRPGRLPPGDQGPRPRRLPRPGAGAVVHRRGDRARGRRVRPRRALPDAGDDPRGRHPGPGDGAGPAGLPDARPARRRTGTSRAPRAASPARSGRSTCGPRTSSGTTCDLQAIYARDHGARGPLGGRAPRRRRGRARRLRHGRPGGAHRRGAGAGAGAARPACSGRSPCGPSPPPPSGRRRTARARCWSWSSPRASSWRTSASTLDGDRPGHAPRPHGRHGAQPGRGRGRRPARVGGHGARRDASGLPAQHRGGER